MFGDIRDAVAAVPLEAARQAVVDLLERVGRELGRLDLDAAAGQIKRALGELEARAVAVVAEAGGAVQEALDVVLDAVESLPIEELVTAIRSALPAVDGVITTVQTGAAGYLGRARNRSSPPSKPSVSVRSATKWSTRSTRSAPAWPR